MLSKASTYSQVLPPNEIQKSDGTVSQNKLRIFQHAKVEEKAVIKTP